MKAYIKSFPLGGIESPIVPAPSSLIFIESEEMPTLPEGVDVELENIKPGLWRIKQVFTIFDAYKIIELMGLSPASVSQIDSIGQIHLKESGLALMPGVAVFETVK